MKKELSALFVVVISFLSTIPFSNGQDFVFGKKLGFSISNGSSNLMAVGQDGSIYIAGYFLNQKDLDPGPAVVNVVSAGEKDIFIQKLDASGNFVWGNRIGGNSYDEPTALTVDAEGNVYLTGYFSTTVDFDPGPGTAFLSSTGASVSIFVLKLNSSGTYEWAHGFGHNGSIGYAIAVDAVGAVHVAGVFKSTDFDPGPGEAWLYHMGNEPDVFILKLDRNGNYLWAKLIGEWYYESVNSLVVDANGAILLAGYFNNTVDFDPGPSIYNLTSNGLEDFFVLKLDSLGNFQWARSWGNLYSNKRTSLATDSFGNVYLTGDFQDIIDLNPGAAVANFYSKGDKDIFLLKLDPLGNYVWAHSFGGSYTDIGLDVKVDQAANVYLSGYYNDTIDMDPSPYVANLIETTNGTAFLLKLDALGNFQWTLDFNTLGHSEIATIGFDPMGHLYAKGFFSGTIDIDPSPNLFELRGNYSSFLIKLRDNPVSINSFPSDRFSMNLSIFPNPCSSIARLQVNALKSGIANLACYNLQGQLLKSFNFPINEGEENYFDFSVEDLPAASYLLELKLAGERVVGKLIKF